MNIKNIFKNVLNRNNAQPNQIKMQYSKEGKFIADTFVKTAKHNKVGLFSLPIMPSGWRSPEEVLSEGLDAVLSNPKTTDDEKTIARIGQTFASDVNHYYNGSVNRVLSSVMKAISGQTQGAVGYVLADVINDAARAVNRQDSNSKEQVLLDGLEEISRNPKTTEEQKEIARLSITYPEAMSLDTLFDTLRDIQKV